MTLQNLIQSASVERLSASVLEQTSVTLNLSLKELLNAFAREVAEGYLDGKYSWEFGDTVMNNFHSCAYVFSDLYLPDFAWNVFAAFDEGEYIHTRGSPDLDGEPRTKALLLQLIERQAPNMGRTLAQAGGRTHRVCLEISLPGKP